MIRSTLLRIAAAAGIFFTGVANSQTPAFVTFSATHIYGGAGNVPMPDGSKLCVIPTDKLDRPTGYRVGSGSGQGGGSVDYAQCGTVTGGAIASMQVLNSAASYPVNACLRVTLFDPSNAVKRTDKCVQTGVDLSPGSWCQAGGGVVYCNWDQYGPLGEPLPLKVPGPPGPQGTSGCIIGSTCTTSITPQILSGVEYNAEQFPGSDLGAKIQAADNAMFAANVDVGTINVNAPGSILTAVTLAAGHSLRFNANVTQSAAISLGGNNRVSCGNSAVVTTTIAAPFTSSSNNLFFINCSFSGIGGDILNATGSSHIRMSGISGNAIGIIGMVGGSDLHVSHSTVDGATYGVVTLGTNYVTVEDLGCTGTGNCAQWQNHDANFNAGGPNSRASVTALGAGHYAYNNIRCTSVQACVWGSVGYDIVVSNSQAIGCGDVCFDAEGSMDVKFIGNTGTGGGNAVGSTFFFSDNNQFINSTFTGPGTLILVKNSSGNPNLSNLLQVSGGTLDCGSVACNAIVAESTTAVSIMGTRFRNGVISTIGQQGAWTIANNIMEFGTAGSNAITIAGVVFGALVDIYGNRITASGAPAGSSAILVETSYANATQSFRIKDNTTIGFPVDITTANDTGNPSVGMISTLDNNWTGSNNVVHTHPNGNFDSYAELSRMILSGGQWVRTVFNSSNSSGLSGVGTYTAAATIAPTTKLAYISGSTATSNITPPAGIKGGDCITLVSAGTWSLLFGGNIFIPVSPYNFTTNKSAQACWDGGSRFYVGQ